MSFRHIIYEVQANAAIITFNRPAQLNAWNYTLLEEMLEAVALAENNMNVIGIIFTGKGKAFCAGADLEMLQDIIEDGEPKQITNPVPGDPGMPAGYRRAFSFLSSVRKPVISAINGPCVGIALALILYSDLRFIGESAYIKSAFSERGLAAEHGVSWILPRIIGIDKALDILLSSRKIYAKEATEMGLATRTFPDDELLLKSVEYVNELAKHCAPNSLRIIKAQVYRALNDEMDASLAETEKIMLETFKGDELKEGIAAFMEQRKPIFKGVGKAP